MFASKRAGACTAAIALALAAAYSPALAGVQYVYDSAGRLSKAIYSNGITVEYRYDAAGNRRQIVTSGTANTPADAVNDSYTVTTSSATDLMVRANDTDPNVGDTLTIISVTQPSAGSVTIQGGGTHLRFIAPATPGVYTFTYTLTDNRSGSDTATVTVTVNAANAAPDAVNDSYTAATSTAVDLMVRANDTDPNGDPLTITAVTQPSAGTVSIQGGGTHLRYNTPSTAGVRTFTYTISDGKGGTDTATVTVNVTASNSPPVANDDFFEVYTSSSSQLQVRINDSDPNGDPITITSVGQASAGSVSIGGGGLYLNYTAPGLQAWDTFSYTISDGKGGTATATVNVSVVCDPYSGTICEIGLMAKKPPTPTE